MNAQASTARAEPTKPVHVGEHLREWRQRRHLSQLDLAVDADISARHLSFVETGRAAPSREMVLKLAERLDVPLRERNVLLVAAGYAPAFPQRSLDDPMLKSARQAIDLVLKAHEPNPALAYGTTAIPRVQKIVGPGNQYVQSAKRQVYGTVDIDMVAGPSEVVIIADDMARSEFVAADLLAQAEHGEDASAVLVTTSERLANEVAAQLSRQAELLPRRGVVEKSLAQYGVILIVTDLDEACSLVNELAPEHLEIVTRDNDAVAARILHAGAIFFGPYTPEVVGDYFAGPNHVLPTAGAARFSSALGVHDFVKRTSVLRYSREALTHSAEKIAALAKAEGLDGHARSAVIRLG